MEDSEADKETLEIGHCSAAADCTGPDENKVMRILVEEYDAHGDVEKTLVLEVQGAPSSASAAVEPEP